MPWTDYRIGTAIGRICREEGGTGAEAFFPKVPVYIARYRDRGGGFEPVWFYQVEAEFEQVEDRGVTASVSSSGGPAGWLTFLLPLGELAVTDFAARRARRTGRRGLIGAWTEPRLRLAHRLVRVVSL